MAKNTANRTQGVKPLIERAEIMAVVRGAKKTGSTKCETNILQSKKVGEVGMTGKEALIRVKTGNFSGDYGFDWQLLVDAVGIIGEILKSGQISEVVRCKDCKWWKNGLCESDDVARKINDCGCYPDFRTNSDWFCADGERR